MFRVSLASIVFFLASALNAQEPDLKGIIRKAIEAHGGEEKLAKMKATSSKFKGTIILMEKTIDITGESLTKLPDKFRNTLNLNINGMTIETAQIFDGKRFWVTAAGNTQELKDEKMIKEVREQIGAERAGGLIGILKDPAYELAAIGETKVKDQETFGIRVGKKNSRDVNMFFDKKTHLIAKVEMRTTNPMTGQEQTQTKFLLEYTDSQGLKTPGRLVIEQDGNPFMDLVMSEVRILDSVDDSQFAP